MKTRRQVTVDGNEAAALVAYKTNEVIAIYPITPASPMGEWADQWGSSSAKNIWGTTPRVVEMQSEAGAAGTVHGALQAGSLTTTFTASQGLLLMIPNMYKIAGELTSTVFHIAARSLAAQGLSIFGDHADVMAARQTGWATLFANSVQEAHDFSLISQASTLKARVPFLHCFDGFRTSHEVMKIEQLTDDDIKAMISDDLVREHRRRGLTPDRPVMRGTAQNPDVYFQGRESANPFYDATPGIVQEMMDRFAALVGRQYHLFDYVGAPDAERVVVMMGSGCETTEEAIEYLAQRGEKVGLVKVRLFRPFSVAHLLQALPATVSSIAVMDRTKEPGSAGEPMYQDVVTAVMEGLSAGTLPFPTVPRIIGGRYGLSSKEFTPSMAIAIFDELKKDKPKNHFTVGINDDVTHTSLDYDQNLTVEAKDVTRAMFWGLGADGTVGANKNTIKIIGEETPFYAQGYFVYDSKKSGARTISHLRFGSKPIRSTYLIQKANFIAVHQIGFLERFDCLREAEEGATLLLNSPHKKDQVWDNLPRIVQEQIIAKHLRVYVIDAYDVARELGLGGRINTLMQTCFFALSGVLPRDEAIDQIKRAIKKTYGKRGQAIVEANYAAVDSALANLHEVDVPATVTSVTELRPVVSDRAPDFVKNVTAMMMSEQGDLLPVSAMPVDGTYPTGTTCWEKRNIALEVPMWDPDLCIQCGKCVMVCPHAVIRAKVADEADLVGAPAGFKSMPTSWRELPGKQFTIGVSVEDCTGCQLCVEICPAKDKVNTAHKALDMVPQLPIREEGRAQWEFFENLPEMPRAGSPLKYTKVKDVQLLQPLFEFSFACAGCGETPYLRLMSQLFGDRAMIANATGCSSIYGGNLPTTPWTKNRSGRGPAWSNSLFEDNAEFGLGMRLALDKQVEYARELVARLRSSIGDGLTDALLGSDQSSDDGIEDQRARVKDLKTLLAATKDPAAVDLAELADQLVRKNVWIIGGDGWAYDIGYGGLDHVLASGRNVNILVLDTEMYSNTGGQASKSTSIGAVAKFAAGGKSTPKKDLGRLAMSYGYVYVAQVAMGASDNQVIKALQEAESYDGPSLIIAYSHCINHGIDMAKGMSQQEKAVESGYWPLYRFDPRLKSQGKNPFQLDSKPPRIPLEDYIYNETRYTMLKLTNKEAMAGFLKQGQEAVNERWKQYEQMARGDVSGDGQRGPAPVPAAGPKLPPGATMPPGATPTSGAKLPPGATLPPGFPGGKPADPGKLPQKQ